MVFIEINRRGILALFWDDLLFKEGRCGDGGLNILFESFLSFLKTTSFFLIWTSIRDIQFHTDNFFIDSIDLIAKDNIWFEFFTIWRFFGLFVLFVADINDNKDDN